MIKGHNMTESAVADLDKTAALADFLCGLSAEGIPASLLDRATDLLLDHIAVSIQGAHLPWSRIAAEYAAQCSSPGRQAVVYGYDRAPVALAALANGTIAHGIELDDTHDPSCTHPGAVVFSAALAVAQTTGASGRQLLLAAIAGYEAMGRAGAALDPQLMARGFHPTALCGLFGSSAAAAMLLGASSQMLQSAWGIGLSMVSGSMQFTEDAKGTMVKRMHAGWPAHNGIVAVQLALQGFEGPRQALDGRRGFAHMYSPCPQTDALIEKLGSSWVVENMSIKRYACCRLFHALIDAIRQTQETHKWKPEQLAHIEAFGPNIMSAGHMEYRPESVMSAQYSLPYSVAVAMAGDPSDPQYFSADRMGDPALLGIADLVTAVVDPGLEKYFPAKFPGGVRLGLKNGETITHHLLDSMGTPQTPMTSLDIEEKFKSLTSKHFNAAAQERLISMVKNIRHEADIDRLAGALTGRGWNDLALADKSAC